MATINFIGMFSKVKKSFYELWLAFIIGFGLGTNSSEIFKNVPDFYVKQFATYKINKDESNVNELKFKKAAKHELLARTLKIK